MDTTEPITANRVAYSEQIGQAPQRPNKMRNVEIRELDKGYFVQVGCQTIAIASASQLISLLAQYIANPNEVEQKYMDGKLF